MNKVIIGYKARGTYYEGQGEHEKAIESYLKCRELPDVLRALALAYSDLDDVENAVASFEAAVKSGDLKSLPWLVTLLEIHKPNDPQIPALRGQMEKGIQEGTLDFIFSFVRRAVAAPVYPCNFLCESMKRDSRRGFPLPW